MESLKRRRENLQKLIELLEGEKRELIFTDLKASSSGMSRTFRVYVINNNELVNVTYLISSITENTFTKDGKMRIYGCGMDMLFETCYLLNCYSAKLQGIKADHDYCYTGLVNANHYQLI